MAVTPHCPRLHLLGIRGSCCQFRAARGPRRRGRDLSTIVAYGIERVRHFSLSTQLCSAISQERTGASTQPKLAHTWRYITLSMPVGVICPSSPHNNRPPRAPLGRYCPVWSWLSRSTAHVYTCSKFAAATVSFEQRVDREGGKEAPVDYGRLWH